MMELRPTCEHCDVPLPPTAPARICSFECTFCVSCAERALGGVCPNCGGNFVPRPIRPAFDWNGENYLGKYPAGTRRVFSPADLDAHRGLVARLRNIPPGAR